MPVTRPRDHDDSTVEPDLLAGVSEALRASHPLPLLELVSTLLAVLDPRPSSPFGDDDDDLVVPTRDELIESFLEVERRETSALLAVIAELLDDEVLRARIAREVRRRGHHLPRWLARLSDVEVYGTTEMVHVLGDGDDLIFGARFADGRELTAFVYVDHNVGTIVKDAFATEGPVAELLALTQEHAEAGTEWHELDPADARGEEQVSHAPSQAPLEARS
jgi:hypothetical protein